MHDNIHINSLNSTILVEFNFQESQAFDAQNVRWEYHFLFCVGIVHSLL